MKKKELIKNLSFLNLNIQKLQIFAKKGIELRELCSYLENNYQSKSRIWASYGSYSRTIFQKQCKYENINYPFSNNHINIKNLFALCLKLNSEVKIEKACEMLSIKKEFLEIQ